MTTAWKSYFKKGALTNAYNLNKNNMKLFTVGPVQPYPEIAQVYQQDIPYFRTPLYGDLVLHNLERLAAHLNVGTGGRILYYAASGTGAMEATIDNCLIPQDKVLAIDGGTFGHRFCELLEHYAIPHTAICLAWDEALTPAHLAAYEGLGYTALLVNLHETSTGQYYDLRLLSDFCRRNGLLLIVDAISTFLADAYDMAGNGVDVTIFSSQKALCLSPGAAFIALSERMQQRLNPTPRSQYFEFGSYLRNLTRGQTPFTPAVNIMYEMDAMLSKIEREGGLQKWLEAIETKCRYFREKVTEAGFEINPHYTLSHMMTPIFTGAAPAYEVFKYLAEKHDIYVNPCGGELADKMLRISHVGNTTTDDIDTLIGALCEAVQTLS